MKKDLKGKTVRNAEVTIDYTKGTVKAKYTEPRNKLQEITGNWQYALGAILIFIVVLYAIPLTLMKLGLNLETTHYNCWKEKELTICKTYATTSIIAVILTALILLCEFGIALIIAIITPYHVIKQLLKIKKYKENYPKINAIPYKRKKWGKENTKKRCKHNSTRKHSIHTRL